MHEGKLKRGCFVRLNKFQASQVKGKRYNPTALIRVSLRLNSCRIIIVLDIDVLEELGECEKIGEPKALELKTEDESKPQSTTISSNGFYGAKPQPQQEQQQQRSLPSRTGGTSSSAHANIYPIEALSPYAHKWTIKARCTNKSDIKTWLTMMWLPKPQRVMRVKQAFYLWGHRLSKVLPWGSEHSPDYLLKKSNG